MPKMKGIMSSKFKIHKKNFRELKKMGCKYRRKMSIKLIHTILGLPEMITKTEINNSLISNLKMISKIKRIEMPKKLMRERKK